MLDKLIEDEGEQRVIAMLKIFNIKKSINININMVSTSTLIKSTKKLWLSVRELSENITHKEN